MRNGGATIRECLESLASQSHKPKKMIVVLDGSTDKTPEIVHEFQQIKVIKTTRKGSSHAINTALKETGTEFVFITEADAAYDKDYLKHALQHFNNEKTGSVIGRLNVWKIRQGFLANYWENYFDIKYSKPYSPPNGWVYRTKLLKQIEGFNEKLERGQDVDVGKKVKRSGYNVVFEPKSLWYHAEALTFERTAKKAVYVSANSLAFYLANLKEKWRALLSPIANFASLLSIPAMLAPQTSIPAFAVFCLFLIRSASYISKNWSVAKHKKELMLTPLVWLFEGTFNFIGLTIGIPAMLSRRKLPPLYVLL
ncbi:glycosyltransferase family 2 protein [Candidatus Micrarchaeota archaeon]|nr:glycosyltransferase family 2 protein [Candidatus Micrarchaeota archaeon]